MATFDFGLLTILIVEDNGYMRRLQRMLLHALGVGNVIEKSDGGEAIEFLRKVKENPTEAGVSTVDMMMSNWQMEPIDGAMLLKWVRRSKESPDRFIPFVMVPGYGDAEKVAEARNLGATEFVAKPYSVGQLLTRLMLVVGSPRQFVLLDTYFGPDRRRRTAAPPGKNRRIMPESEIEIIHDDS
jgi:CheY-like chemotaxis protein